VFNIIGIGLLVTESFAVAVFRVKRDSPFSVTNTDSMHESSSLNREVGHRPNLTDMETSLEI